MDTFIGDIDDVMIRNEMRTQEQILEDSRKPPKETEKNLVAYWVFERVRRGSCTNARKTPGLAFF